jgi:ribosome-associated toxin RatA of RatAB toxin-antitoxin module
MDIVRVLSLVAMLCIPGSSVRAQDHRRINHCEPMVKHVTKNDQSFFEIAVRRFVRASPQQAWRVLTDYERLPKFVPNLQSSKVISREGNEILLEQNSEAGFLFISQNIHLVVRVTEQPHSTIDVTLVSGDLKHYAARWEISPAAADGVDGACIAYSGEMEPNFFVPPLVGEAVVERDVKMMVEAVAAEIGKGWQFR